MVNPVYRIATGFGHIYRRDDRCPALRDLNGEGEPERHRQFDEPSRSPTGRLRQAMCYRSSERCKAWRSQVADTIEDEPALHTSSIR